MSECYNMENEDDDLKDAARFGAGVITAIGVTLLCVLGWVVFRG